MQDLETAKKALRQGMNTCVLCRGDTVKTSQARGVAPMLEWIAEGLDLHGFSVADRVVGKAAAMLFLYAGITAVYAVVLSAPARAVLEAHGVPVCSDTDTPCIRNRADTGLCPMETAVADLDDPQMALAAILAKRRELQQRKGQNE